MIKINKNISITGQSTIGEKQVAYMNATVSTDGSSNGNINVTITDETVYAANKIEVRKDINDFQTEVYSVQDDITNIS